jgi:hypothetical protein
MKYVLIFIFSALLFTSCKKAKINSELMGSWKLVRMYNETNGTFVSPPTYANRYAGITFQSNGKFYGNTLYNGITDGLFALEGTNNINFIQFSSTKVYEDEWGQHFTEVLMSCYLQSVSPCIQPAYVIKGNQLTISSVTAYDLIFEKE